MLEKQTKFSLRHISVGLKAPQLCFNLVCLYSREAAVLLSPRLGVREGDIELLKNAA